MYFYEVLYRKHSEVVVLDTESESVAPTPGESRDTENAHCTNFNLNFFSYKQEHVHQDKL